MTRRLYAQTANTFGEAQRVRTGLPWRYLERVQLFREQYMAHGAIRDGHELLELGTGWVHWESIVARLFFDVNITMFDIRDNRQIEALRSYCQQLDRVIDGYMQMTPVESARVHSHLGAISAISSLEELYRLLRLKYVCEPSGRLGQFGNDSFDAVFSYDVLQHVRTDVIGEYVRDISRILRPNGFSIHTIDLSDHLSWRDHSAPAKNYLRYSDRTWKYLFENSIQCINRIQRSEWLDLFASTGLEMVQETPLFEDIRSVTPHRKYMNLDRKDIYCTTITLIHRKPQCEAAIAGKERTTNSISSGGPEGYR